MSTKIKTNYPPKKKKFSGIRGLIAEQRDFRGGSTTGEYIDTKLANALESLLNSLGTTQREYFVMQTNREGVHRGPWTEKQVDDWIDEWNKDGGKPVFYKASRIVGEIR